MEIIYRPLSELTPLEANPRTIANDDLDSLIRSIDSLPEYFMARPIILSNRTGENVILAGNQRYRAALQLGLNTVPTALLEGLTEEREREIIIRDNISNGRWDVEALKAWDIEELKEWMGDQLPDFKDDEILDAQEDEDFDGDDFDETDIVLGDLFEIGPHRLICGDSTEMGVYDRLLNGVDADMVLTDPPYNVDYEGGTGMTIENDNMEDTEFYQFLYDFYTAAAAHTKAGGAVYIWHASSEAGNFITAMKEAGWLLKQELIWVKSSLVMGRQDYQWRHEPCLYGWKPGAAHYFTEDRTKTTVIEDRLDLSKLKKPELMDLVRELMSEKTLNTVLTHNKPSKSDLHPTMKPVPLFADQIRNSSRVGETVLDPFGGSGTTMVAAHQLKRCARLIELDPIYCQRIINRMRAFEPGIVITRNGQPY